MTLSELRPPLRRGLNSQLDRAIWPLSTRVDELGRLCIGGVTATDIAAEFGTPTYVVDEEDFRARIRCFRAALPGVDVVYAGKALLSAAVAGWAAAEGAGVGVSSAVNWRPPWPAGCRRRKSSCTAMRRPPATCTRRPPPEWDGS